MNANNIGIMHYRLIFLSIVIFFNIRIYLICLTSWRITRYAPCMYNIAYNIIYLRLGYVSLSTRMTL